MSVKDPFISRYRIVANKPRPLHGVRTPGDTTRRDLHRGDFDVDESAIAVGVEMFTAAALLDARLTL
jgi:metal-dependent amidase/aminoacylase/carboxypeptidase family protein